MVKSFYLSLSMLVCVMLSVVTTSCSKDDEPKTSNGSSIVGTWIYEDVDEDDGDYDNYTLVFNKDNTGYIRNDYGSRAQSSEQMNFDWTLTTTANGQSLLSVIYKSGDRYMDGPFEGGYAQWNRTVTVAGNTLSIVTDDYTVMIFHRK